VELDRLTIELIPLLQVAAADPLSVFVASLRTTYRGVTMAVTISDELDWHLFTAALQVLVEANAEAFPEVESLVPPPPPQVVGCEPAPHFLPPVLEVAVLVTGIATFAACIWQIITCVW